MTAKAALSISYDENSSSTTTSNGLRRTISRENPIHCKIMCLVGLIYCGLVDRSLFAYAFKPAQIGLAAVIATLTLIILSIHAKKYQQTTNLDHNGDDTDNYYHSKRRGRAKRKAADFESSNILGTL